MLIQTDNLFLRRQREMAVLAGNMTKQRDRNAYPMNLWFCAVTVQ
jgi:hypothetical protein